VKNVEAVSDRRAFLHGGAMTAVAAAFAPKLLAREREDRGQFIRDGEELSDAHATLLMEPGVTTLGGVGLVGLRRSPWAFPIDAEPHMDKFSTALFPAVDAAERWGAEFAVGKRANGNPTADLLTALADFPVLGGDGMPEASAALAQAIAARANTDIKLDFFATRQSDRRARSFCRPELDALA
jgi:hypothetical protein